MKLIVISGVLCLLVSSANAQYGVNWPTQPSTPMATDVEPGTQTLRVSGVNDLLYTYDINVIEVTTPVPPPVVPGPAAAPVAAPTCGNTDVTTFVKDVTTAKTEYDKLFPTAASPAKSLQDTQNNWVEKIAGVYSKLDSELTAAQAAVDTLADPEKSACNAKVGSARQLYALLQKADDKLNRGSHIAEASFQAKPCKSEILTITEKYRGVPTGQAVTVRLDCECDEVTASAGVLETEIQNRSYNASPLPTQTGQFLSVSGTGKFHTTAIFLTNFNLPVEPLGHRASSALGNLRVGISTGPTLQSSSSKDVSSFGWFVGGSLSIVRRFYLTPGVHFGQFADFPLGFRSLTQIPANFGTLTPTTRYTARFAFAITVKGWDISKLVKGGQDQPKTSK